MKHLELYLHREDRPIRSKISISELLSPPRFVIDDLLALQQSRLDCQEANSDNSIKKLVYKIEKMANKRQTRLSITLVIFSNRTAKYLHVR